MASTPLEPVVDCHQHFWDTATHGAHYQWLQDIPDDDKMAPLKKSYLVADFERDTADCTVLKTVHVQGEWRGEPVGETAWLSELAKSNPKGYPHAIVAYANLGDDDAAAVLDAHCKYPLVRGIRQLLNWHDTDESMRVAERDYLSDPAWRANFKLLAERNLLFECHIFPHQMSAVKVLASEHPNVQFVLDHIGCPMGKTPEYQADWLAKMKDLATCPNVACKISGLIHPMHTNKGEWTVATLKPWVTGPIEAFGVDRCLYASNFPVDGISGSYTDMLRAVQDIVREAVPDAAARAKIYVGNATRIYRL